MITTVIMVLVKILLIKNNIFYNPILKHYLTKLN